VASLYSGVAFPATGLFIDQATDLLGGLSDECPYGYGVHNGEMAESVDNFFLEAVAYGHVVYLAIHWWFIRKIIIMMLTGNWHAGWQTLLLFPSRPCRGNEVRSKMKQKAHHV
jgi:hypothetical protein